MVVVASTVADGYCRVVTGWVGNKFKSTSSNRAQATAWRDRAAASAYRSRLHPARRFPPWRLGDHAGGHPSGRQIQPWSISSSPRRRRRPPGSCGRHWAPCSMTSRLNGRASAPPHRAERRGTPDTGRARPGCGAASCQSIPAMTLPGLPDAAAAMVATDDDVLNLDTVDGVFHHRQAVGVWVHHHVGHVAVNEYLTRL